MKDQKDKIRIAHIAGGLVAGGVETVIYNYFSHMNREDYQLIYICYNPPDEAVKKKFEDIGFQIYEVPRKKEHFFRSCMEVYHILKEHQVQIVHSNMTLMCFVTNILGRIAGAKVLISHSHLALNDKGTEKILHGICKTLSRVTATDYFACGEDASEYLFGRAGSGKVLILYNAIDLEEYAHDAEKRSAIRSELGLENRIVLGHIGRFTEQKNHSFVLKVFHEFLKLVPDARLVMVGDGPLVTEIKRQVESDFQAGQVIMTGSRQDIPAILSGIDLLLFPSIYEGLPLTLIEAQAAGLRILASDRMDQRVDITNSIHFLSLDKTPVQWAKTAFKMMKGDLPMKSDSMTGGTYDIRAQVQILDEFYHHAVRRS